MNMVIHNSAHPLLQQTTLRIHPAHPLMLTKCSKAGGEPLRTVTIGENMAGTKFDGLKTLSRITALARPRSCPRRTRSAFVQDPRRST